MGSNRSSGIYRAAARCRLYGIGFKIFRRAIDNRGNIEWEVVVEPSGPRFQGRYQAAMAFIEAYKLGYLAGRKYTEGELFDLRKVIKEVSPCVAVI